MVLLSLFFTHANHYGLARTKLTAPFTVICDSNLFKSHSSSCYNISSLFDAICLCSLRASRPHIFTIAICKLIVIKKLIDINVIYPCIETLVLFVIHYIALRIQTINSLNFHSFRTEGMEKPFFVIVEKYICLRMVRLSVMVDYFNFVTHCHRPHPR